MRRQNSTEKPWSDSAALWSALVPGLGQWRQGRRRRGSLLALPALGGIVLVILVAVWVSRDGVSGLARILVQPRWLWALLVVNTFLALVRVIAVADVWRPGGGRRASGLGAVVLTLVMLVPHAVVQAYGAEALGLLEDVFTPEGVAPLEEREGELLAQGFSEEDLGPVLPASTLPPATTTTTAAPVTTAVATSLATTTTGPAAPTVTYPDAGSEPDPVFDTGPLGRQITVLLAGGDFGPGRHDLRTDVMIVAVLDVDAGKATLIGVSRDLVQAPLPAAWAGSTTMRRVHEWHFEREYQQMVDAAEERGEGPPPKPPFEYCNCYADRINYLHVNTATWVRTWPETPDPGMEALRQTLGVLLGIPIDYYVLVDFAGFVQLVDALGGVDVTVTESMDVGFSPAFEGEDPVRVRVDPGRHRFDGRTALAYVRNRTGSNDGERMRRQRCMIRELAAAANPTTLFLEFPTIARAVRAATTTTLPLDLLPDIIEVLGELGPGDIATLAIGSPGFTRDTNYMGLPIVDAPRARAAVADLLAGVAEGTTLGNAPDECG